MCVSHTKIYTFALVSIHSSCIIQDNGIYYQTYDYNPKIEDQGKDLSCSLESYDADKEEDLPYDSITISTVTLFDISGCVHCNYDPTGDFAERKNAYI